MQSPVEAAGWEGDVAYRYGASLYVQKFFWEAHEVWEAVWKACSPNSIERRLLRGLIQLANAALKLRMARPKAALRLLREADEVLGEAGAGTLMGVAIPSLRAVVRDLAAALESAGTPGGSGIHGGFHAGDGADPAGARDGPVAGILRPLGPVALDLKEGCIIMHQAGPAAAL